MKPNPVNTRKSKIHVVNKCKRKTGFVEAAAQLTCLIRRSRDSNNNLQKIVKGRLIWTGTIYGVI